MFITGGYSGYGVVWIYAFPLLVFYLKKTKKAFYASLSLIAVFYLLMVFKYFKLINTPYDFKFLTELSAAYIAVVILSYVFSRTMGELFERLKFRAIYDGLTNVYNRTYAFDKLKEIFENSISFKKTCLIYIDLDNFKQINDTKGHDEGDKVIRSFAKFLYKNFRRSDVVARIGGDEFLVIAHDCDSGNIRRKLERLRIVTEKLFKDYGISFSYGFVVLPDEAESLEIAIKIADERMYKDKKLRKGKGRGLS